MLETSSLKGRVKACDFVVIHVFEYHKYKHKCRAY